jgi:hypothetical protein
MELPEEYHVEFYCYHNDCPGRTEKEPWPHSRCGPGWLKVASKKGNVYKKKTMLCMYCSREMSRAVSLEAGY